MIISIVQYGSAIRMKKVVVLGCLGMAGHIVTEYLAKTNEYEIKGIARSEGKYVSHVLDVTDFVRLKKVISTIEPDYIINCIGALVSTSANDICTAIQINSYLPHYLAMIATEYGFKLIHISTDCVFSGKVGGYREDSFRDGDDNYARTKALGEVINGKDLTIRTSIIGPELKEHGTGLLDWFLKQSGEVDGYTKAYWSGVTTLELAKAIHEFIKQDISDLFQLCPDEKISKYDLLNCFSAIWNTSVKINKDSSYSVDKSLISTRDDFNYQVPGYDVMLKELHDWMVEHSDNYKHYLN